ncbi:MAG: 4-hydroxy-tetrahydrodipicolinate synthase [Elusimicrobia bacterium]|nr:4-hydroxy-tetrahydrodipicolinate synthase [Elusimicrobiota bacterium]
MFYGSCVALVTPFKDDGIDEEKLKELVHYHIENKTEGLVPCGSTGESATMTHKEHARVIEIVVKEAGKKIPVIAGTGSNSTQETIELTQHAKEAGADASLLIVPYYNKPTQSGVIQHFSAVCKKVSLPIIVYNIPGRTGINMLPSTLIQLVEKNKNIVGIKESSGNLDQVSEIAASLKDRENFTILSGDDSLTLPILSVGGKGVISVLANIAPKDTYDLCSFFKQGQLEKAQKIHYKMFPLMKALLLETNPIPIKTAMGILGICSSNFRLPLCAMDEKNKEKLIEELKNVGCLQ